MDQNITAAPPDAAPVPPPMAAEAPPAQAVAWTPGLVCIAALIPVLAFFLGSFRAANSDIWMTLASGKLLATGQYQIGVDPFSWASAGSYWANPSWVSSWLAYLIYENLGPSSLVIAKALCIVVLAGLLFAARSKDSPLLPGLELTALTLLVGSQGFILRSTVLSYVALALLLFLLTRHGFLDGRAGGVPTKPSLLWQFPLLFIGWSNLDGYFVLGLAVLAFVAIGLAALANSRAAGIRLAIVLGLSTVACALNPHFLANFTLPLDLAYMFQDVLPSSMTAAGQTASALRDGEPGFFQAISPFSSMAVSAPDLSFNFAGLAFHLLVMLNLVSFIAAGFAPGTKSLLARGLVCLALLLMAAFQIRLTPFYAVAAGPLTLLNFTDYLRWSRSRATARRAPARFATLMTFFVAISAVGMAWPGWLHLGLPLFQEATLFHGARRVEWELQPDPSLHRAALSLKESVAAGQVHNVLNLNPDIGDYCAFFAPEVKYGLDQRLALFAAKASEYAALRNDLYSDVPDDPNAKRREVVHIWPKTMADWNLDALVVTNVHRTANEAKLRFVQLLFLRPTLWKPTIADSQTLVVQYSPSGAWPPDWLLDKWRREAFGPMPPAAMLPYDSNQFPPGEPLWLLQYARGPGQMPLANSIAEFDISSYSKYTMLWQPPYYCAFQAMQILPAAGHAGAVPGQVLALQAAQRIVLAEAPFSGPLGKGTSWYFNKTDFGPPALPILVTRELRKSIAQNPNVPVTHARLAVTVKQLTMSQEEWWCQGRPSELRQELHSVEIMAALRNAVTLAPWDRNFQGQLTDALYTANFRDAALVHLAEFVKTFDDAGPIDVKQKGNQRPDFKTMLKQREHELKSRRAAFELRAAGLSEMNRFRLAVTVPWENTDANNKVVRDPRGCGLVLEGINILERIDPASLNLEEKSERAYHLIRLYCYQGKLQEAIEVFTKAQKDFAFSNPMCLAWIAAATAGYKNLDEALAAIEANLLADLARNAPPSLPKDAPPLIPAIVMNLNMSVFGDAPVVVRAAQMHVSQSLLWYEKGRRLDHEELIANCRGLRGSYALERGDTAHALAMFEGALTFDGPFRDRGIAARCRDLIRQEK